MTAIDRGFSAEEARDRLAYSPETGVLRWKHCGDKPDRWNTRYAGSVAGTRMPGGDRVTLTIGGVRHKVASHVVIWLIVTGEWPAAIVDHENRCPWDNRWLNLRLATKADNCTNKDCPLGEVPFRGVTLPRNGTLYLARITRNRVATVLGRFANPVDAARAYDAAADAFHGAFAVTNRSLGLLGANT